MLLSIILDVVLDLTASILKMEEEDTLHILFNILIIDIVQIKTIRLIAWSIYLMVIILVVEVDAPNLI